MSATHVLTISDWVKLPEVAAPAIQSTNDTGTIVMVAKVGFLLATDADCKNAKVSAERSPNGKCMLPTAMIEDRKKATLHRLPTELASWAMDVVALARAGRNQLPAKVEFGRIDGRVYAEFIVAANER
jgi:hypothetical protein